MQPPTRTSEPSKYRNRGSTRSCGHVVQFYDDDAFLIDEVARHITIALDAGHAAIVIATLGHREALEQRLVSDGKNIAAAVSSGRYVALDAANTLSQFMVNDWPDPERFARVVGSQIEPMLAQHAHVHAFGEMVALLWADGKCDAAIALEKLWNGLAARYSFSLHCAYPLHAFSHHSQTDAFVQVCTEHSDVIAARGVGEAPTAIADQRIVAALQQQSRALAAEIEAHRETADALQDKLRELTVADRRKNEFLAMLGHELRNPLSPIFSALQILQLPEADAQAVRTAHESIAHQTRHLARIVDALLDVTRITSGKIELKNELIDIAPILRRAIDATTELIESGHHQVTLTLPSETLLVRGDPTRLEQVFVNLLNNASKYMPPYGRIAIRAERCADAVRIAVEDKGVGLSPEIRPKVFELFTQEERSLDRSLGGLGVGLWMVRKLVELHKGSVDAYSDGPGKGSRFVVTLPVAKAGRSSGSSEIAAPHTAETAAYRILVVDDNRDAADNLALLCRMTGHTVEIAYDGVTALDVAATFDPDVVLLDIGLPGRDGYSVARALRSTGRDPLWIIAMTGYGADEDRRRSHEAGVDVHLVKPVEPAHLFDLLSRPLETIAAAHT